MSKERRHFTIAQVRGNMANLTYAIEHLTDDGKVELDPKLAGNLLDICKELVWMKINPNFGV